MKKVYRRLLQFSALVVFLATAPLIVFYAMGYRITSQSIDPLPVGVVIVDALPRRSEVVINERSVGTTPTSISDLSPGAIGITVQKQGYTPWHKELTVEPTAVTEARSIRLFPIAPKRRTVQEKVKTFSMSPSRKLVATQTTDHKIHILDETGTPLGEPIQVRYDVEELFWSPDSNNIIVKGKNRVGLLQLAQLKTGVQIVPRALQEAQDMRWDPRIPGRLLLLNRKNEITAYSLDTQQQVTLITNAHVFGTSARNIYATNKQNEVVLYDLQGRQVETVSLPKDENEITKLSITPGGRIALQRSDKSVGYLNTRDEFVNISPHAEKFSWSPDGQMILIQRDETALHIVNVAEERLPFLPLDQLQLVVRLSRSIRSPQWFAGGRHIIYQVDDEIVITEIDTRDHPTSYTADSTNLGEALVAVGEDGATVFYLKKTDAQLNLVATELVVE